MTTQIHFLLMMNLDDYTFNPHRPEGISFTDSEASIVVEIISRGKEDDYHFGHRNLELRAKCSCDATQDQIEFVESLIVDKIIKPEKTPIRLPYLIRDEEVVTSEGHVKPGYSPTADFLSKDLEELCISAGVNLEKHAIRFIELLRWIEKAGGPVKIRDSRDQRFGLYWKTTQDQYYGVPWPKQGPFNLTGHGFGGLTWSDEDQKIFAEVWKNKYYQEPLGHQLLREARGIAEHNHRSALLICYSALEVGIKQHISKCVPDAGWLAMHAPTPPLFKILRDYLPIIHNGKVDFERWVEIKPELNLVTRFVEDRNRLAHRGDDITGSLDDYLRVTGDLLFTFDVLEGHSWAKNCVSQQFGKLLGWSPNKNTFSVTVELIQ